MREHSFITRPPYGNTMAEALATNQVNVPFPDGISGMYCQAEDKVYVINEVLNYYQRKFHLDSTLVQISEKWDVAE